MTKIFEKISDKNHEQIVYCNDPSSGLKAIIAIHGWGGNKNSFKPFLC